MLLIDGCALHDVHIKHTSTIIAIILNIATNWSVLFQQDHTVLIMFFMLMCVLNCFKPPPTPSNSFGGGMLIIRTQESNFSKIILLKVAVRVPYNQKSTVISLILCKDSCCMTSINIL